jgi:hypothetical protein
MSNKIEIPPKKLRLWERLALIFETMEKTETDYLRDEIATLSARQSKLENELRVQVNTEGNFRLHKVKN